MIVDAILWMIGHPCETASILATIFLAVALKTRFFYHRAILIHWLCNMLFIYITSFLLNQSIDLNRCAPSDIELYRYLQIGITIIGIVYGLGVFIWYNNKAKVPKLDKEEM